MIRFGRRRSLLFYMSVAACSLVAVMILDLTGHLDAKPTTRMTIAFIGRAGISAGWAIAYLLSAELFPTVIR